MSYRTYRILKFVIILILLALTALAWSLGIAWIPIPAAAAAIIAMVLMRRGVKEIVVDERNYTIANRASRFAFQIGAIIMAFTGITLSVMSNNGHPELGSYGDTLVFSTAGLLIIYLFSMLYHSGKLGGGGVE
jgi:uncharacterized membrane protein